MANATRQAAYVVVKERTNAVNGAGAALVAILMMVASWPSTRIIITIALVQAAIIAFNVGLVNGALLRAWGVERAELFRNVVNIGATVLMSHVARWPLPAWLMLPYVALVFDSFNRWVARGVVVAFCAGVAAIAIHDGVAWLYPVSFSALALYCMVVSDVRFATMRTMVVEKEAQRLAVDEAHASLKREVATREAVERELRQAQKLEALGRLASGVAHEINTPIQFVGDSVSFLQSAITDVFRVIAAHDESRAPDEIAALEAEVDMPFLKAEIPSALALSLKGLDRVATIVRSMRRIAHPDQLEVVPIDVNAAVKTAIVMSGSAHKDVADLVTTLQDVPHVRGHAGEIHQVMLNLLVNALHAVADAMQKSGQRGTIAVTTRVDDGAVAISIRDTGGGIPEAIRDRIFEPFFTTKAVGRGTGQGLAIARSIVQNHGGTLTFDTSASGTTFHVRLPILGAVANAA